MVIRVGVLVLLASSLVVSSCTDATLIDTPRRIDTLAIDQAVRSATDVTSRSTTTVRVNGAVSSCELLQSSRCTRIVFYDGRTAYLVDVVLQNTSIYPTLPVDVHRWSLRSDTMVVDEAPAAITAPYGAGPTGATIRLFNAETERVDYVDSTRVQTTVTRRLVTEQRTLDDLVITRRYDGFDVRDDTARIPFDVFDLRSTDLTIDTSYAITIRHIGNRSQVATTILEPPTFGGAALSVQATCSDSGNGDTLSFTVSAANNPPLQSLLGPTGTAVIEIVITP